MTAGTNPSVEWLYRGIWRVVAGLFRVPRYPPSLPHEAGEFYREFHPSHRYLGYLKFYFWLALGIVDLAILVGWIALFVNEREVAFWLALPTVLLIVVPDVIAYVAIHLRYDTMWYVMTDRSLRCRRGIWVMVEHTITFENVQNVSVHRGPLQYHFRIATVVVETAGASEGEGDNEFEVGNKAILQGIGDPDEIRSLIMERVQRSRTAGLGDEDPGLEPSRWTPDHIAVLREISNEIGAAGRRKAAGR